MHSKMHSIRQTSSWLCCWWWVQKSSPALYQNMVSSVSTHNQNISWPPWIQILYAHQIEGGGTHSALLSFPANSVSSPPSSFSSSGKSPLRPRQIGISRHRQKYASSENNNQIVLARNSLHQFLLLCVLTLHTQPVCGLVANLCQGEVHFGLVLCFHPQSMENRARSQLLCLWLLRNLRFQAHQRGGVDWPYQALTVSATTLGGKEMIQRNWTITYHPFNLKASFCQGYARKIVSMSC